MPDRVFTIREHGTPGPAPGLFELRVLERDLVRRIAAFDDRVDGLLRLDGGSFADAAGEIDVLCAAIAEAAELLEQARRQAAAIERRPARRRRVRRWS
jgi:hypothetical protein